MIGTKHHGSELRGGRRGSGVAAERQSASAATIARVAAFVFAEAMNALNRFTARTTDRRFHGRFGQCYHTNILSEKRRGDHYRVVLDRGRAIASYATPSPVVMPQ